MKKMIHHIRRQPEHVRRHILNIVIVVFAAILIMLWIYSLGTTLANPDTQAKMSQDLKPFSAIKNNMVGGYNMLSSPNAAVQQ
jgi:hypothetical protein